MHRIVNSAKMPTALARAALEELRHHPQHTPRFAATFCSQCGKELGPGDSGVSHCTDHWLATIVQPYGTVKRPVFPAGLPSYEGSAK